MVVVGWAIHNGGTVVCCFVCLIFNQLLAVLEEEDDLQLINIVVLTFVNQQSIHCAVPIALIKEEGLDARSRAAKQHSHHYLLINAIQQEDTSWMLCSTREGLKRQRPTNFLFLLSPSALSTTIRKYLLQTLRRSTPPYKTRLAASATTHHISHSRRLNHRNNINTTSSLITPRQKKIVFSNFGRKSTTLIAE